MQAISPASSEHGQLWESDMDASLHETLEQAEAHEIKLVAQTIRKIVNAHVRAGVSLALRQILFDLKKDLHDPYEKLDGKKRPQSEIINQLCAAYEESVDETSENWLANYIPDDKE